MTETSDHPSPALLRHLSTLRDLAQDDLRVLSNKLQVHVAPKGTQLLRLGAVDEFTLYLLEGRCRLIALDGAIKVVSHTDPSALAPLARLRPSQYQVLAETEVRYLKIDNAMVDQTLGSVDTSSSLVLDTYQVEEEDDLGHMAAENRLTLQIYEDLNSQRLLLPSLPHVAVSIGEAVNDEDADARKIARLIETDPAIALKIVKAANSARYGGISQIGTVTEAVARLGMQNTRTLVITFALRELFRTPSKQLEKRMQALWEHCRRIAALTRVLGDRVGGFNSHEALLAGLIHDIGVVAVIGYARDVPDVADNPVALESSIHALRTQLSGMILSKWQLPSELVDAAKEAENWYRKGNGKADYADLVIVAQLHEGIGGDIDPSLVPALGRLGLSPSEIDRGLELLHDAHEEVAAARQLLSG
ncbi:MAG: HDOD domain-containing protein [Chromatiaceae bacterium]|nr:HDOD domain-containing protein [Chromatiaceae bacterium]